MLPQQIVYLILTLLSHAAASIFLAKPRFNLLITSLIWLAYETICLLLLADTPTFNFFISLILHFILFIITTKGKKQEKIFLFFSYACVNTCFSIVFNIIDRTMESTLIKVLLAFVTVALMQIVLYKVILPSFKKVTPYIKSGWWGFYAVAIIFLVLFITQTIIQIEEIFTKNETIVFFLVSIAFCITYIVVFNSMKNIVELYKEKQKQIHTKLLQAQVDAQAQETQAILQNRHDMRHHYQMLLFFANDGNLDKIIDYLECQNQSIEAMIIDRFCENETVNNILKFYYKKATEAGIRIEISAAVKPELSITPPEIVQIIANILENALHGAIESKNQAPFMEISIKYKSERLAISCKNSCKTELDFEEMPSDLYGIGMRSITSVAEKYNGTYSFSAKNGEFIAKLVIDD